MKGQDSFMTAIARFVTKRYKLVLLIGVVVIILGALAASRIEVKTEIKDLMPEDYPQIQSYMEIDELFAGGTSIIITIEGNNRDRMIRCAEDYVNSIRSTDELMKHLRAITLAVDDEFIRKWGLLLQDTEDLGQMRSTFSELNILPFITSLNDSFEEAYTGDTAETDINIRKQENQAVAMLNQLEIFFTLLREYLEDPNALPLEEQGKTLAEIFLIGDRYGFNYDNSMLIFTLVPNFDPVEYEILMPVMDLVKEIEKSIQADYPDVELGYTGDIPVQADEQIALSYDMLVPALIALAIILVLFVFSFGQLRSIVFIIAALAVGIILNYGFVGISTGQINMLTSLMAVLLIGLGVDYGIQIVTNFTAYRRNGHGPAQAMINTFAKAGMGVLLAALTTAIAFFVMALTGTKAFAQFGVVLGVGIIMCLLTMMFILPSLLIWFGKKDVSRARIPQINFGFLAKIGKFSDRHRCVTVIIAVVVTAGLLVSACVKNRLDYDLMGLEPQNMTSIIHYKKIMEKYDFNPFHSMVVCDSFDESRAIVDALEKEPLVAEVVSVTSFLPTEDAQLYRLAEIKQIRQMPPRYSEAAYTAADMDAFGYEVQRAEWNIIEMGDLSVAGLGEINKIIKKRSSMIRENYGAEVGGSGKEVFQRLINLVHSDPTEYGKRLSSLDRHFTVEMDAIIDEMSAVDRMISIDDVPDSFVNGFIDESGTKNMIVIYPVAGLMETKESMERFNSAMTEIDPRITGTAQLITVWMEDASSSTIKAAIYIFVAVLIFLLASFRNIKYTVLAIAPLIIGLVWMLGIYPLLGFKINIINIVVIPLVIGMGIDFGIHLAHRFQVEQDIHTVYTYTGKAVFLSAFTTMIGFGSLALIGKFPSMASVGVVLFFGIAACLAAALFVLPALLSIGKKKTQAHHHISEEVEA